MNLQCNILEFTGEYHFLSNFHPSEVEMEGWIYPTVEHAYQAAKTSDLSMRRRIRHCPSPGGAKRLGRKILMSWTEQLEWDKKKPDVMLELLRKKFSIPKLRQKLLETGILKLVEGNDWGDHYWGICEGRGLNMLGWLLMKVRDELREGKL